MNDDVGSVNGVEMDEPRKCRVHGLLFDAAIAGICPLCERERTDRLAASRSAR